MRWQNYEILLWGSGANIFWKRERGGNNKVEKDLREN